MNGIEKVKFEKVGLVVCDMILDDIGGIDCFVR